MKRPIFLFTGGTGGHVLPAIGLYHFLKDKGEDVILCTDHRGARFAGDTPHLIISSGGGQASLLKRLSKILPHAMRLVLRMMKEKPKAVIGFGGYPSAPGGLAAFLSKSPLFLVEQNLVLGKTNRLLAPFAKRIFLGFPISSGLKKEKTYVVGPLCRRLSIRPFSLKMNPIRVLVIGGSQGAKIFTERIPQALGLLPPDVQKQLQVRVQSSTPLPGCETSPFFDMADQLSWAHVLICRAGASTISEIFLSKRPALLIPYPHATDDHQTHNAQYVVSQGGGWVLPQKEASPEALAAFLKTCVQNPETLLECHRLLDCLPENNPYPLIYDALNFPPCSSL